jgi:hypothetical protein
MYSLPGVESDNTLTMRGAVRFPLKLPVTLKSGAQEIHAETHDISAAGVMFNLDNEVAIGSDIEFTISIPAEVIGAPNDVLVSGAGRIVRCDPDEGKQSVAAIIDEYHFERS